MSLPALVAAAILAATPAADEWVPIHAHHPQHRRHRRHPKPDPPPLVWHSAVASWYAEHGTGACGLGPDVQSGYRFASLILRCGTRVRFCRGSTCEDATMADHGPYVAGRTFDLNAALARAVGCSGVCSVRWAVLP